jgi:hypothetical protein
VGLVSLLLLAGCGDDGGTEPEGEQAPTTDETTGSDPTTRSQGTDGNEETTRSETTTSGDDAVAEESATAARPDWLGTRELDIAPGEAPPPTPPELDPRQVPTEDVLPPPADDAFHATVAPVPPDVVTRSTWQEACPVTLDELRYVTVSFWGFDDTAHTGEMLVHRDAADPLTQVFERLFDARFPIEDMRVTSVEELGAPDTGDGNATAAFVCRPTRGSSSWSQHAYGLAIDINPFQNPYVRSDGGLVPWLARTYLDRDDVRPGMLVAGGEAVAAFADIGWGWGGEWTSPIDYMHFSASGR